MSLCFVFSGTSEGRELVEALSKESVKCSVFVATEYGETVMTHHENVIVNVGRLDKDQIKKLIETDKPDYVIDATHPHAEIVSDNIITACDELGINDKYMRVSRTIDKSDEYADTVIKVSSKEEALKVLNRFPKGNIMLTTGVKELSYFCTDELKDRIVTRVLPCMESITETVKSGVKAKNIIAMEGPFSEEINIALINQYGAKVLVTKNSGDRGGYKEKIKACVSCGIKAVVIEKDCAEANAKSVAEAVNTITGKSIVRKKVYLTAASVCNTDYLTKRASDVIEKADVIIGAKRMTEFARGLNTHAEYYVGYVAEEVKKIIEKAFAENIVVLFSGDTGLCSGAKKVYDIIKDIEGVNAEIIPGISSISYFASKIGIQYSDVPFISLHGKECDYMEVLNKSGGFTAICSGQADVRAIVNNVLKNTNGKKSIYVGYNLGSDCEKVFKVRETIKELDEGLYVIAVI